MKCPQCQQSVSDQAEYCEHCGYKLGSETNETSEKKQDNSAPPKGDREEIKDTKTERTEDKKEKPEAEERPKKKEESSEKESKERRDPVKKAGVKKEGKEEEEEEEGRKAKSSEEKDQNTQAGSGNHNGFPWKSLFVFVGAIFLVIILYSYLKKDRPPPIPENTVTGASESFYLALRENIHQAGDAKAYYRKALSFMGPQGVAGTLPTTNPTSMPAQQPSFLKAAENFALALENFNKAHDTIDQIRIKSIEVDQVKCKNDFVQATASFIAASQMLNDHAKALYMGDTKRAGQNFITDAQAKYEVADQSMTEILLGGCNGNYFKFLKGASPAEREQAMEAYKSFFQENFGLHQSALELMMDYRGTVPKPEAP